MRINSIEHDLILLANEILQKTTFEIHCLPEDTPVRGNTISSGDVEHDKEVEDQILEDLENNPWAWCVVKATATVYYLGKKFESNDYLGTCSYESESDFTKNSGYYESMKANAFYVLLEEIGRYLSAIAPMILVKQNQIHGKLKF